MDHLKASTRVRLIIGPITIDTDYETLCKMYSHYNSYNGSAYHVAYNTIERDPETLFKWIRKRSYINLVDWCYGGIPDLSKAEIQID